MKRGASILWDNALFASKETTVSIRDDARRSPASLWYSANIIRKKSN